MVSARSQKCSLSAYQTVSVSREENFLTIFCEFKGVERLHPWLKKKS